MVRLHPPLADHLRRAQGAGRSGGAGGDLNPAIFEKAIAGSSDYDEGIKALVKTGPSVDAVYETLAIKDIQLATDELAPVYRATGGRDGYVSLEVSPFLAADSGRTVAEAKRLFETVGRPNLMIKIPATATATSPAAAASCGHASRAKLPSPTPSACWSRA